MMRACAVLALTVLGAGAAAAGPITVTATPIPVFERSNPEQSQFGALTFRGGLVLTGSDDRFGGYSGLRLDADGSHFRAISDRASWLEGRIVYDGDRPVGIADADVEDVLDARGQPLAGTSRGDTEGLEVSGDTAWVTTERAPQLLRFYLGRGLASAKGAALRLPRETTALPLNAGLESVALIPEGHPLAGNLIILGEDPGGADGNHPGWLVPGKVAGPTRTISVRARDGFAVTDLTFLPGGDLLMLERRFVAPSLSIRIRRVSAADIAPGAVLDGPVLMEANLAQEIDNMEGLAVTRAGDGTTVLTLISDDNFNFFQRTVLLQFGLKE